MALIGNEYRQEGNHLLTADAPSIIVRDIYYLEKNKKQAFTFGVWNGKVVSVPIAYKSWLDVHIDDVRKDFEKRGYKVSRII